MIDFLVGLIVGVGIGVVFPASAKLIWGYVIAGWNKVKGLIAKKPAA